MKKIEFNKTLNIFINTGIIALYRYLVKFERKNPAVNLNYQLYDDKLIIESDDILHLLEEAYYFMGKEIYDTSSKKQLRDADKYYFVEKPFKYGKFPKMSSFGLAGFITKAPFGPAPTPRIKPVKFSNLFNENPEFAHNIAKVYSENNLKLKGFVIDNEKIKPDEKQSKGDSNIYLNEPYTKAPRLEFKKKYFEKGDKYCVVTKESFKDLVSSKGSFAFTSSVTSFNSFLQTDDSIKISFKAKYLALFSPSLAMYAYIDGYDSFISSFFNTSSLKKLLSLYPEEFFYEKSEMQSWAFSFQQNIRIHNFSYSKKDDVKFSNPFSDAYSPQEIVFLILLTFYKKKFADELAYKNIEEVDLDELLGLLEIDKSPMSLVTFKADKFASTLRPNFYEEYSNVKFIIQLIHKLESNKKKRVPIGELWRGLTFKNSKIEAINDFSKRMKLQRQIRIKVIDHLLRGKSILTVIESLFQKSYLLLANNDNPGSRRYDLVLEFLKIYEQSINFGTTIMEESLQQRAISLGKSIGYAIINYENPKNDNEKKANAKNGRKYLIGLHKARTIEQFRETLIRIQRKYQVSVANEILESLNERNYVAIKQYAQIGALNSLNVVLSNQKDY